jgi:hypothetical protein
MLAEIKVTWLLGLNQEARMRMEVSYVLTVADIKAFHRYVLTHAKKGLVRNAMRFLLFACMLFSWLVLFAVVRYGHGSDDIPIPLVIGSVVLTLVWLFQYRLAVRMTIAMISPADKAKLAKVRTISIAPEAFHCSLENSRETLGWSDIQSVSQTKDCIYVFFLSYTGHVIPRRPFASDEEFHEFAQTAQRYKKEADEKAARASAAPTGIVSRESVLKLGKEIEEGDRERFTESEPPASPHAE